MGVLDKAYPEDATSAILSQIRNDEYRWRLPLSDPKDYSPDGTNDLCKRCTLYNGKEITKETLDVINAVREDINNCTPITRAKLIEALQKMLAKTEVKT